MTFNLRGMSSSPKLGVEPTLNYIYMLKKKKCHPVSTLKLGESMLEKKITGVEKGDKMGLEESRGHS